jgi:transposase InsO family protein
VLLSWAQQQRIPIKHSQPGKPQQKSYVERCNRTVMSGWPALLDSIEQVQDMAPVGCGHKAMSVRTGHSAVSRRYSKKLMLAA